MASIDDVFGEIHSVNINLNTVQNELSDIKAGLALLQTTDKQGFSRTDQILNAGFLNVSQGLQALIQLQSFIGQTLAHQSRQNDTMICILEHISLNTCSILNEVHQQTRLQTEIAEKTEALTEMYKSVNPQAALEFERQESLERKILACCPEEVQPPPCNYQPCPPPPDPQPPVPQVEYQPYKPDTPQPTK